MINFLFIRDWVSFAANICILVITVYTFFITFISKKIEFRSVSPSSSITKGNSLSVVLENKTLSPILIDNINLIVDNKYKIKIKSFDSPLIIEPFTASKITSDKHSYTIPYIGSLIGPKNVLELDMSGKYKYLPLYKKSPKVSKNIKRSNTNVQIITNKYNEKIVPEFAKYILVFSKDSWHNTVFIFESGVITEDVFGINGLPPEVVKDYNMLIEYLDTLFKPNNITWM